MKRQVDPTALAIVIAAGLLAWAGVVIAAMAWMPDAGVLAWWGGRSA